MAVVIAVALAGCTSGSDNDDGERAPTAGEAPSGYHEPGEPTRVGAGLLEGVSLDGSALYVSARDPSLSTAACEGELEPVLFRLPLAGGEREALGSPGGTPSGRLVRGRDGRVALVSGCEGFLKGVRTGVETPDGRLRDVRLLDTSPLGGLTAVAWSADGQSLLTARTVGAPESPSSVARVDPVTGRATPVFEVTGPVSQVAELADGTYVVSGSGKVSVHDRGGGVTGTFDGDGFTVDPDRRKLAIWGRSLLVLSPAEPGPVSVATGEGEQAFGPADFSPDGRAVAYATTVPGGGALAVVTLHDRRVSGFSASPGRYPRVFFNTDGRSVAFSHAPTGADDDPAVLLVRFR